MHRDNTTRRRSLHIIAITARLLSLVNPAATALVTPSTTPTVDTDGPRRVPCLQRGHRLRTMDGDHMTGKVVLATERTTTRLVVASVGFKTVRVVRLDMSLEIVGAGERCGQLSDTQAEQGGEQHTSRARGTLILALRVLMHVLHLGPLDAEGRVMGADGGVRHCRELG